MYLTVSTQHKMLLYTKLYKAVEDITRKKDRIRRALGLADDVELKSSYTTLGSERLINLYHGDQLEPIISVLGDTDRPTYVVLTYYLADGRSKVTWCLIESFDLLKAIQHVVATTNQPPTDRTRYL